MKHSTILLLCFLLVIVLGDNTNTTVDPPFTPNPKDSIPKNRAYHPNWFSGKDQNGTLNYCNNPEGFNITKDITESCFIKPYVESLAIPSAFLIILFIIVVIIIIIFSCTRCCCGPCCAARHGVCCPKDEKAYSTFDWLLWLIVSIVIFAAFLIPFLAVGFVGNSNMTVALKDVKDSFFDTYDSMVEIYRKTYNTMESIDLTGLQNLTGFDDSGFNSTLETISELNDKINKVDDTVSVAKKGVNWIEVAREVFIDIIFIVPLVGVLLFFIGAVCKCCCLSISIFPCSIIFASIAVIVVAVEFPIVTVISDSCVYLIETMDPNKVSNDTDSNVELILSTFKNCSGSELNTMINQFYDVEKQVVDIGVDFFDTVCSPDNIETSSLIRWNSDHYNDCTTSPNNNGACVLKLNTTSTTVTVSPMNCPASPDRDTASISDIVYTVENITFSDYKFYYIDYSNINGKTEAEILAQISTAPVICESASYQTSGNSGKWVITDVACSGPTKIGIDQCATACPEDYKQYADTVNSLLSVANSLTSVIDIITNEVIPLISCDSINTKVTNVKEATCYRFIDHETLLVAGLLGYAVSLCIIFGFSLLAIKRFNRKNYGHVDESTKYYDDGQDSNGIELTKDV
ncbi:hypothetical protein EDI_165210 [Entamoeba dispar SAW760]|uniref:Uncharacterized protein n=1 Tax=Entamoeba dispar (strain ATCC PRA-260 / SAW760) TaxID=370354 RepID=B0EJG7_ENTDS|nr:uncharacterized protein EDI_165210 [Entamoeba dispar SAW760]EDR25289.1 hypothetical protein EDI_165210 [Entamoeba dispar SAW760]|eukprot:EDR25289.1 hypothetical protein EDI_165210 [Entamoeba dispar SAW760]